jgi:hypothetical protein
VVALNRLSVSEALEGTGGSSGSNGPSIKALGHPKGADLIEVSSNLSP